MTNQKKGFASMDKDKVKEIAAKGGAASHKNKSSDKSGNNNKSNNTK